jgi:hypothetical protein
LTEQFSHCEAKSILSYDMRRKTFTPKTKKLALGQLFWGELKL